MPKVKYVKAGKDYPEFGIVKGDMHYVWAMKMQRGGIVKRSKTAPRASQLTLSEYKVQAHQLNENIEDLGSISCASELEEEVQSIVDDAENLMSEQQEKLDNMPEGLQQGSTGELLQMRIEALDAFISELQGIEFEEFDPDQHEQEGEEEYLDDLLGRVKDICLEVE